MASRDPLRESMEADEERAGNVSLSGGGAAAESASVNGGVNLSGASPSAASAAAAAAPAPRPHVAASAQQAVQQTTQDAAQEIAAQALSTAGRCLRRGVKEVRVSIETNPYSVTLMSFAGGLALTLISLLGLMMVPSLFITPLSYLLTAYQFLFGLTICCIDGPGEKLPLRIQQRVLNAASFLHSNVTRVLFYLFIACQQGSMHSWYHVLLGWYFAFIACAYGGLHFCEPAPSPHEGLDAQLAQPGSLPR